MNRIGVVVAVTAMAVIAGGCASPASGGGDTGDAGLGSWTAIPLPSGSTANEAYGVWGSDANHVWIVGADSVTSTSAGGDILFWNGTTLSETTFNNVERLFGVWGSGPADVWAVGGTSSNTCAILHWDGSQWSSVSCPGP